MGEVKLLGAWPSPSVYRVIWALKLKGIPYEYIEQDLYNKSPLLLQSNPVHKKIPVLIHGGNPIAESVVILQYIEDKWPQNPLLPSDPYEKAVARFWVKFADEKGLSIVKVFVSSGQELEKAAKESLEMLEIIEEHAPGLGQKKFFGGDKIGMVDLTLGQLAHWMGAIEEVTGVKIKEAGKFPRLEAWIKNFKEDPVIKENLPEFKDMVAVMKHRRETLLASKSS
ncbi:hypothetical protein SLA2020_496830 [Shorea laevis]